MFQYSMAGIFPKGHSVEPYGKKWNLEGGFTGDKPVGIPLWEWLGLRDATYERTHT